jgi:hypothetical protein
MDKHHIAGKANSPVTVPVPVNDHRAELNAAQYDWPKETLENPDANPNLKKAALIRGLIDLMNYLPDELRPVAELLESLADSDERERRR